jgi:hypothetical protein
MRHVLLQFLIAGSTLLSCTASKVSNDDPDWIRNKPDGPDLGIAIRILESKTEHWVDIAPLTDSKNISIGKVFVENVSRVLYKQQLGFLVSGTLPNTCSSLHSINTTVIDDIIVFELQSRQDPSVVCVQALQPFEFFYDQIDEDTFARVTSWRSDQIEGTFKE